MLLLGIDTSCDDTSAALVEDGVKVISSVVSSRIDLHKDFGGIVPEIACRSHIADLIPVIDAALREGGKSLSDIDAIAVTNRPGLIGALLIGLTAAKTLAFVRGIPLVAVDHVACHIYANHMEQPDLEFPYVSLVASGGHTHLYHCTNYLEHTVIGKTRDDAAGEAFDKVAAILELGYPGGPSIERAAATAESGKIHFKRTYLDRESFDFSFSGIKTAVLYHVRGQDGGRSSRRRQQDAKQVAETKTTPAEVAAEFQQAVIDVLVEKTVNAAKKYDVPAVTLGGGVAANGCLRSLLEAACKEAGLRHSFPSKRLCTDNAAMVAGLGYRYALAGEYAPLDIDAFATSW
jgi:N6-L-threonylcarbamoyladenine synthase